MVWQYYALLQYRCHATTELAANGAVLLAVNVVAGVEYIRMGGWLRGSSVIVTNSMSDTGIESDSVEDERLKRHGAADEDVSLLVGP